MVIGETAVGKGVAEPLETHGQGIPGHGIGTENRDVPVAAGDQFLRDQAAAKRRPGIDLHIEGLEEEMRGGYIDSDGTTKEWSEEEIQSMLAGERARMNKEYGKKDEEVITKVMEAYDRLHRSPAFSDGPLAIEYYAMQLPK